jgi:hypothetical protein
MKSNEPKKRDKIRAKKEGGGVKGRTIKKIKPKKGENAIKH